MVAMWVTSKHEKKSPQDVSYKICAVEANVKIIDVPSLNVYKVIIDDLIWQNYPQASNLNVDMSNDSNQYIHDDIPPT